MVDRHGHGSRGYWVVQQHDEFTVEEGASRPDTTVEDGERMKAAFGPYATREEAQKRADEMSSRTLRAWAARGR